MRRYTWSLSLGTMAMADGVIAHRPIRKVEMMLLDVKWPSLASTLNRAPTPQPMFSTVKATWGICALP